MVPDLAPTYLLPRRGRTVVHTAPKFGTKPIRYVTLHFRDGRGAALLRQINGAKVTLLMYEQNRLVLCRMGITFFDYEVAQKKYNEKLCIAVFSLAYSFNAAGQGNQWSFKATGL